MMRERWDSDIKCGVYNVRAFFNTAASVWIAYYLFFVKNIILKIFGFYFLIRSEIHIIFI